MLFDCYSREGTALSPPDFGEISRVAAETGGNPAMDFAFQVSAAEFQDLKSQFVISSSIWGGRRKMPYFFTEHGAIMVASVLNSRRAIQVSVYVVRAFVRLRQVLATHKELAQKLEELEKKLQTHDNQIRALIFTIRELMHPAESSPKTPIGYQSELEPHQKQVKKARARPKEVR